jgi:hypothetical protein
MLITSILCIIYFSRTVNLRREAAILYNRISFAIANSYYYQLISYAGIITLNKVILLNWRFFNGITPKYTSLIRILIFVTLQIFTWLMMYEDTVIWLVEYEYVGFFRHSKNLDDIHLLYKTILKADWDCLQTYFFTHAKFFLAMLFNLFFSFIFTKNFIEKHIYFFSRDRFRNFNLSSFGILIFILIILFLPRIIFRNFLTISFFGKMTYLSVVLPVFWLLPLVSYIINLLAKLITKQKIKKQDFSFFNENVVNSVNIYSICLILLFLYIGLYHSRYFIEIILSHLPCFSTGTILYIVPPSTKLVNVFSCKESEAGTSEYSVDLKEGTVSFTQWYLKNDSPLRTPISINQGFGNTATKIISNPHSCIKHFDNYKDFNLKYDTFSLTRANGLYTGANIVAELPDKSNALLVCLRDENVEDNRVSHPDFYIKDKAIALDIITQLKNQGMRFNNFDPETLDGGLFIAAPGLISEYKHPSSVFNPNTTSYKFNDGNYTQLQLPNLGINLGPYVEPNWERIFQDRSTGNRIKSWDYVKPVMGQPKDNSSELIFYSNELGTGRIFEKNGQGNMCLSTKPNNILPYCLSSIDSKDIDLGILDLNKNMGINLDKLENLNIYTQIVAHRQQIYTIPSFTRYMNILPYEKSRSVPLPNIPLVSYTWSGNEEPLTSKLLNKALKYISGILDFYFLKDTETEDNLLENISEENKLVLWRNLKKDMLSSILEDTYNFQKYLEFIPLTQETQIGRFTLFKSDIEGLNFVALAASSINKPLYEGLQFKLETKELFVPTCVNPELKYELYKFLSYSLGILKDRGCNPRLSIKILLWDNFCIQVGITQIGCRTFSQYYESSQDFYLDHLIWKDDGKYPHNSFNLINIEDQELFIRYFNSNINPSSTHISTAKREYETKVGN